MKWDMKRIIVGALVASLAFTSLTSAHAETKSSENGPLNCNIGPVQKMYGQTIWLVYSCNDNKSVVIMSAPNSPASPFYFIFSPGKAGYELKGEGTGNKTYTDLAAKELSALKKRDISTLIEQTKKGL